MNTYKEIIYSKHKYWLLSTNNTYLHDLTEILLKVALNTTNQPQAILSVNKNTIIVQKVI